MLSSHQYYAEPREHADRADQRRLPGSRRSGADQRGAVGRARHVHQRSGRTSTPSPRRWSSSLAYQDLVVSLDYQQLLLQGAADLRARSRVRGSSPATPSRSRPRTSCSSSRSLSTTGVLRRCRRDRLELRRPRHRHAADAAAHPHPGVRVSSNLPPPHDATWQAAVAQSLVDSPEYRTDFIRGVYAKFLTYSVCAVTLPIAGDPGATGFLSHVPGGGSGSASSRACSSWESAVPCSSPSSGADSRGSTRMRCPATAPSDRHERLTSPLHSREGGRVSAGDPVVAPDARTVARGGGGFRR